MDICWTYLGSCKRVSVANHVYTFHASLRASEFIRKMWDDEVVESLIETSPWQKKRCLVLAKRQSQRDVLSGAMRWLFHGRTMSRRWSASERPLKTDSTLLETALAQVKRCWKILPGDESNKAKGYIQKLVQEKIDDGPNKYLPHFAVVREGKEATKVRTVLSFSSQIRWNKL